MNAMHDYGASAGEIANHFNIARSTVYRTNRN
jgi:transposase